MKKTAIAITALAFSVALYACGERPGNAASQQAPSAMHDTTAHQHSGDDAIAATLYGCPMHKEMIGSRGDKCPKCNYMEMVPVTWSLEGVDTVRVTTLPDYQP